MEILFLEPWEHMGTYRMCSDVILEVASYHGLGTQNFTSCPGSAKSLISAPISVANAIERGRIGMLRLFNCLSFLLSAALVSVLLRNFLVADPAAYGLKVQIVSSGTPQNASSVSKSGS